MKVLLDTNIILDFIMQRQPFANSAVNILKLSDSGAIEAFVTSNSITDIFYILRKFFDNPEDRRKAVGYILQMVNISNVTKTDIYRALELGYADFEDALQTQCARKVKANYIITRNEKDFINSPVKVISPEKFIEIYYKEG